MSQLSLFGGRRQRGRKPPPAPEINLHIAIADTLKRWGTTGWRWTCIAHGGFRLPVITAVRLKRMGLRPGFSDFLLLSPYPPKAHFLEVKRRGGKLSDAQAEFQGFCELHEYPYAVVDDYQSAMAALADWGAIRVSLSTIKAS
ncbi:MAG TPA: VRR-NUC domain-containing protein [Povalibacter sp.]|nr:VRR-NUC domain-containing protein [Povalibacter sp.]